MTPISNDPNICYMIKLNETITKNEIKRKLIASYTHLYLNSGITFEHKRVREIKAEVLK